MEVGIILEHDEEGYRIDKDSMSNPSLKGSVQQRWSNELLSLIAELVQEKKHIYWKAFDDPVEAGFQVEQSSLNEYQEQLRPEKKPEMTVEDIMPIKTKMTAKNADDHVLNEDKDIIKVAEEMSNDPNLKA